MVRPLPLAAMFLLSLSACGPNLTDVDARIAAEDADTAYPDLVPLGPLLDRAYADPPRPASLEGPSIEERAADLRRRAARLRSLPL